MIERLKIGIKMAVLKKTTSLAKPKSVWSKKVKMDFTPLFKSLGKAAAHAISLKFDELAVDAVDVVSSLGLESTPEERAYVLLQRALFDALLSLTKESASHLSSDPLAYSKLSAQLELELHSVETIFNEEFFRHPQKLEVLPRRSQAPSATLVYWIAELG